MYHPDFPERVGLLTYIAAFMRSVIAMQAVFGQTVTLQTASPHKIRDAEWRGVVRVREGVVRQRHRTPLRDPFCTGTQQFASSGTAVFGVTGSNPSGQSFKALERPRYGHVLVAVGSKLYAIGGSEGPTTTHEALGTMEIMDTSHLTPEWTGGASMQYARFMPAATAVGQVWSPGPRCCNMG